MKRTALFPLFFLSLLLSTTFAQVEYKPNFWGDRFYKDDIRIKKKEASKLFQGNAIATDHFEKAKMNGLIGAIVGVAGISLDIAYLSADEDELSENNRDILLLVSGLAATGASIYFQSQKKRYYRKAVEQLKPNVGYIETQWGLTKNGMGLSLTF